MEIEQNTIVILQKGSEQMKISNTQSDANHPIKMLIFGESGSGKTSLAGTIKEPTLLISAESGLLTLKNKSIDVIDVSQDDAGNIIPKEKRIARLGEAYQYLLTDEAKKKYKWIFIDSLTELSQNMVEQLNVEFPERKDSLVMYGENAKRMRSLVKSFRDMPFYNVVFTALSTVDKDENGTRFTNIDLIGSFANKLPGFLDEVFYLHVDKDGNRSLLTQRTDRVVSKDRSGRLDKFEPADLNLISEKINVKLPKLANQDSKKNADRIIGDKQSATTTKQGEK